MYTITLNDGTKIEGLTLAGNILWSRKELSYEMFRGKLNPVTISGTKDENDEYDWGGVVGEHSHMEVCYIRNVDGKYALALRDIPNEEWNNAKRDANISYIAMMTGVNLNV